MTLCSCKGQWKDGATGHGIRQYRYTNYSDSAKNPDYTFAEGIIPLRNGYLISGHAAQGIMQAEGLPHFGGLLLRLDNSLGQVWMKKIGTEERANLTCVLPMGDTAFLCIGDSPDDKEFLLYRTDTGGNVRWKKSIPAPEPYSCGGARLLPSKGIVVWGTALYGKNAGNWLTLLNADGAVLRQKKLESKNGNGTTIPLANGNLLAYTIAPDGKDVFTCLDTAWNVVWQHTLPESSDDMHLAATPDGGFVTASDKETEQAGDIHYSAGFCGYSRDGRLLWHKDNLSELAPMQVAALPDGSGYAVLSNNFAGGRGDYHPVITVLNNDGSTRRQTEYRELNSLVKDACLLALPDGFLVVTNHGGYPEKPYPDNVFITAWQTDSLGNLQ